MPKIQEENRIRSKRLVIDDLDLINMDNEQLKEFATNFVSTLSVEEIETLAINSIYARLQTARRHRNMRNRKEQQRSGTK